MLRRRLADSPRLAVIEHMKRTILFACVCMGTLGAAPAPDSISGTVLREFGGIASLRALWEHTIMFGDDGRYSFLKTASASTIDRNWSIDAPPEDGTYSYSKTGPTTAIVTFSDRTLNRVFWGPVTETAPIDSPASLTLDFGSPSTLGGDLGGGEFVHSAGGRGTFSLTRLSTLHREALPNISMRGVVSRDRPLIVGFVLRGDARDVLIRVVGPSLKAFGVNDAWENPRFDIYQSGAPSPIGGPPGPRRDGIAYYDDWSSDTSALSGLQRLFVHTGAFPLEIGSKDAVGVTPRFAAGAYTVVCTPLSGTEGGEALVEVYVLP